MNGTGMDLETFKLQYREDGIDRLDDALIEGIMDKHGDEAFMLIETILGDDRAITGTISEDIVLVDDVPSYVINKKTGEIFFEGDLVSIEKVFVPEYDPEYSWQYKVATPISGLKGYKKALAAVVSDYYRWWHKNLTGEVLGDYQAPVIL